MMLDSPETEARETAAKEAAAKPARIALVGNPNCGKTAMFNALTGSQQKVANYPGVTVERKEGAFVTPQGRRVTVVDLPGTYSLRGRSPDEVVTRDVILGRAQSVERPDLLVCVADSTNLRLMLRLVLELSSVGIPMILVLNMWDIAEYRGIEIDIAGLSRELGIACIPASAVTHDGSLRLRGEIDRMLANLGTAGKPHWSEMSAGEVRDAHHAADSMVARYVSRAHGGRDWTDRIDRVLLHPVAGILILLAVLFLIFQAVFSWAVIPMDMISAAVDWLNASARSVLPESLLTSLLTDGIITGVGSVLVFLPQILILFFFILALEDSGYLPRAAFLLDRIMGTVGLSGRSFIPLLSSFACAIPGIMATRTITHWRERLVTIMIAPLMTCSARLPVYALLIASFIPDRTVGGLFNLQGLVMFALYMGGILGAMAVAAVLKIWRGKVRPSPLLMELPPYRVPSVRNLGLGLYERAAIFLKRVGGIILALTVLLWFLSTYPAPPDGATGPAIQYSMAGQLGRVLEHVFAPLGFNWQISIALVPGMAAREVVVGALGTVYALSATGDDVAAQLGPLIAQQWSLATALSLLVWFVFAPQCLSTLATVRRETNSWGMALLMAAYLFGLAYAASWVTYRLAVSMGGG